MFDEIPEAGLVAWSALITAYTHNGLGRDSLVAFRKMRFCNVQCNEFTLPTLLKASSMSGNLFAGMQIHAVAVVTGFVSDVFVVNALVVMYANFGLLVESRKLFDGTVERNVVSWNGLLTGYARNNQCDEAIELFREMVWSGTRPNEYGFSCILNACTGSRDLETGRAVHGHLTRLGYDLDLFTANALVDMYAKLGIVQAAAVVFDKISQPDIISWNAFIAGCVLHGHNHRALELLLQMKVFGIHPNFFTLSSILKACAGIGMLDLGHQIHCYLIKADSNSDLYVGVGLVDMYAKCDHLGEARKAFRRIPQHDLVSWNALISGCSHSGSHEEALSFFNKMRKEGFGINRTTLSAVLKSTACFHATSESKQVHALAMKAGGSSCRQWSYRYVWKV